MTVPEQLIINPVILIGGSGTRLWPLSRVHFPKQFNKFSSEYSLFQETLIRAQKIKNIGKIYLVVGESNYLICLEQLQELAINNVYIIVEPVGRNTAPAIAVSAHYIQQHNPLKNNLMLVLPSDHQIKNIEKFIDTVRSAEQSAYEKIILFGVVPNEPSTGYGYIQTELNSIIPVKVEKFLEKPNIDLAKILITKPNCYWNSGIFFFSPETILHELQLHAPHINDLAKIAVNKSIQQGNTCYLHYDSFASMPNTPIDIAIMEKTNNASVFPLQSDWSDLGDWSAVYKSETADENGNVSVGNVLSISTKNSYLHSTDKLLTTIGVDNLVVVSAKDSLLITDKNKTQDVKKLVELLKLSEFSECTNNDLKVYRPWGSYESLINMDNFQVKHIVVKPGAKLSLQMHQHRSEHWIIVKGIADVVCGENTYKIHKNESTYIPKKTKHRLMNLQDTLLEMIEVQVGDYLGEDDIERFDDVYGRTQSNFIK